ncbi:MAG: glycosyltransferase [Pseudomonadota bacterium]
MRVLLLQGQSVYDPSSGAAQSMRQMAESLALAGCEVRSLATTGCENGAPAAHLQPVLARLNIDPAGVLDRLPGAWLDLDDRGVRHHLLITEPARRHQWALDHGPAFERQWLELLAGFSPQVVLTFGLDDGDLRRRVQARQAGARVVMVLHNLVAAAGPSPAEVDAFWVPSAFMHERHLQAWGHGAPLTTVPTPLGSYLQAPGGQEIDERVFVTFVNPEPAKGVAVVAGLVQRWLESRPGQPVLIVEGRARADQWFSALQRYGVSPSRCEQVFVSPSRDDLSAVWASSRVVLMPSLVDEAAGRVALEAMLNGVVPVVSDRGALPETVDDAGCVVPLPEALHWQNTSPVVGDAVSEAWDQAVSRLLDDDEAWQEASARSMQHAQAHLDTRVGPLYRRLLDELLSRPATAAWQWLTPPPAPAPAESRSARRRSPESRAPT